MSVTRDRTSSTSTRTPSADRQSRIFGFVAIGLVVVALIVVILALRVERVDLAEVDIPQLTIVEPREGATVRGPIDFVFEVDETLRPGPAGWGVGPLHIHMESGRREYMPRFDDIRPVGQGRYVWTMPPFADGERTFRLVWATETHGSIPDGASEPVTLHVVGDAGIEPSRHPQLHH